MRAGWLLLLALLAAPQLKAAEPDVELITLGTGGGPVVQTRRAQPANAVRVGTSVYLFDIGEGTQRQMQAAGIELSAIRAIFLTHHHLDHVGGLGPLLANRWVQTRYDPLPVVGPPGTRAMSAALVEAYRAVELAPVTIGTKALPPLASTVAARDLDPETGAPALIYEDAAIRVFAVLSDHYHFTPGSGSARIARSYAYRIEANGKVIVLTGDTGPSKRVEALAQNADLLVSEVMDRSAIERELVASGFSGPALTGFLQHMDANHLTPGEAGSMATRAHAKMLILSHFVPGRDNDPSDAGYIRGIAGTFRGPVVAAKDLDRFVAGEPGE